VSALAPQAQWNGKVVYTFRRLDRPAAAAVPQRAELADDAALSRGFMVVDNGLHRFALQLERVLVAETLMDDEGAHRRTPTARSSTRWATAARRLNPGRTPRLDLPGLLDGIRRAATTPIQSPPAWRSPIA